MDNEFLITDFETEDTIIKDEEALNTYLNTLHDKKQIEQHIPIMFYIVFGFMFIAGWFAFFKTEHYEMLYFALFATFLFSIVYFLPLGLKLYMAIGLHEYSYAIVDELGDSKLNYKTRNGRVIPYPCLYMHLPNGEHICYEFGNKKPCREFYKGERIEVKLKGSFFKPVEKLY